MATRKAGARVWGRRRRCPKLTWIGHAAPVARGVNYGWAAAWVRIVYDFNVSKTSRSARARMGQELKQLEWAKRGADSKGQGSQRATSDAPTLKEIGINKSQSSRSGWARSEAPCDKLRIHKRAMLGFAIPICMDADSRSRRLSSRANFP